MLTLKEKHRYEAEIIQLKNEINKLKAKHTAELKKKANAVYYWQKKATQG